MTKLPSCKYFCRNNIKFLNLICNGLEVSLSVISSEFYFTENGQTLRNKYWETKVKPELHLLYTWWQKSWWLVRKPVDPSEEELEGAKQKHISAGWESRPRALRASPGINAPSWWLVSSGIPGQMHPGWLCNISGGLGLLACFCTPVWSSVWSVSSLFLLSFPFLFLLDYFPFI